MLHSTGTGHPSAATWLGLKELAYEAWPKESFLGLGSCHVARPRGFPRHIRPGEAQRFKKPPGAPPPSEDAPSCAHKKPSRLARPYVTRPSDSFQGPSPWVPKHRPGPPSLLGLACTAVSDTDGHLRGCGWNRCLDIKLDQRTVLHTPVDLTPKCRRQGNTPKPNETRRIHKNSKQCDRCNSSCNLQGGLCCNASGYPFSCRDARAVASCFVAALCRLDRCRRQIRLCFASGGSADIAGTRTCILEFCHA